MGKKSRNRSAKAVRGDGACSHAGSAVPAMKKALAKEVDFSVCKACRLENRTSTDDSDSPELFICLRCCLVACRRHVGVHFRAPRSDLHCHFLSSTSGVAHCVACSFKALDEDENHSIQSAVTFLMAALRRSGAALPCLDSQEEDWRSKAMKRVQGDSPDVAEPLTRIKVEKTPMKDFPCGLTNLGATCYMNSSLQSLAACRAVRHCLSNFLTPSVAFHLDAQHLAFPHDATALPERLAELLARVRAFEPEWSSESALSIDSSRPLRSRLSALKAAFSQRHSHFTGDWTEQDAHEFLRHLVDMVGESARRRATVAAGAALKGVAAGLEAVFRTTLLCVKHCAHCRRVSTNTEPALDVCVALDRDLLPDSPPPYAMSSDRPAPLSKHKMKKERKDRRRQRKSGGRSARTEEDNDAGDEEELPLSPPDAEVDVTVEELFGEGAGPIVPPGSGIVADRASSVEGNASSEDENNYDLFADDSVSFSYQAEDQQEEQDQEVGVSEKRDSGAAFLAAWSETHAEERKSLESAASAALIERMVREDAEIVEREEDGLVPLFSDVSLDTCLQFPEAETSSSTQPGTEDAQESQPESQHSSSAEDSTDEELPPELAALAEKTLRHADPNSGLEALLDKYFERSIIDDFKCPGCGVRGDTSRRQILLELPQVFVVSVKRFRGGAGQTRKIGRLVDFPLELDLAPFTSCAAPGLAPVRSKYRLRAVIQHQGSARSGHYVAFVAVSEGGGREAEPLSMRRGVDVDELSAACQRMVENPQEEEGEEGEGGNEKWFLASDLSVTPVSIETVLSAQAYVLFYERG